MVKVSYECEIHTKWLHGNKLTTALSIFLLIIHELKASKNIFLCNYPEIGMQIYGKKFHIFFDEKHRFQTVELSTTLTLHCNLVPRARDAFLPNFVQSPRNRQNGGGNREKAIIYTWIESFEEHFLCNYFSLFCRLSNYVVHLFCFSVAVFFNSIMVK